MAEMEKLTEAEHAFVQKQAPNYVWEKLVRIHDAQAERIRVLEALLREARGWLDTHDERGICSVSGMTLDPLCEQIDAELPPVSG